MVTAYRTFSTSILRFGTRQDLIDLVADAHRLGLRVVLDIILNHAGDVFAYRAGAERCDVVDSRTGGGAGLLLAE